MTSRVDLSTGYYPNPDIGRSLSNANIYVGIVDLDPVIVANQKQISVLQENGTTINVSQPITTSAGGVPQYNGSPVTILVDGSYSIKVTDSVGTQVYYVPQNFDTLDTALEKLAPVDSIAALRAITYTPEDGQGVSVLGYYTPGDGGGQSVYWDSTSTATHNGLTVFELSPAIGAGRFLSTDISKLNLRHAGAKGDAVTDDTASIVNWLSVTGIKYYAPIGKYRFTSTIDLTQLSAPKTIYGVGQSFTGATEFLADTGGIAFDCTGTGDMTFKTFRLQNYDTNITTPSTVGFLLGRSSVGNVTERNNFEEIHIYIATDETANSNNGTVGIYNGQSEIGNINNCDIRADNPCVFTRNNIYGITSSIVTSDYTANSMASYSITGESALRSLGINHSALTIQGGTNIDIDAYYQVNPASVDDTIAAVRLTEAYKCTVNGFIEGYGRAIIINGYTANLESKMTHNYVRSSVVFLDGDNPGAFGATPSLQYSKINIVPLFSGAGAALPAINSVTSPVGIVNSEIYMYTNQTVQCASSAFTGNIIYADANPSVSSLAGSTSFQVFTASDIRTRGAQFMPDKLSSNQNLFTAGNFVLSAGWGTTATVSGINSNDQRGDFVVNSLGTGQLANPTITITFTQPYVGNFPVAIVERKSGDQATVKSVWSVNKTTLTITFSGTPLAGQSMIFAYIIIG